MPTTVNVSLSDIDWINVLKIVIDEGTLETNPPQYNLVIEYNNHSREKMRLRAAKLYTLWQEANARGVKIVKNGHTLKELAKYAPTNDQPIQSQ